MKSIQDQFRQYTNLFQHAFPLWIWNTFFSQLNPWIVPLENLKFVCGKSRIPHDKKITPMTVLAYAPRQGNHHCPLSNSLSNLWHSTPNINKSGHNNLGSKFSVVMTKKELSIHNIAQGAHSRTVTLTSKCAAQYILLLGSQLCVHVRVSIVFGC